MTRKIIAEEMNATKVFPMENNHYILYIKTPNGTDEYHLYEGALNKGLLSSYDAISMILKHKARKGKENEGHGNLESDQ